MPSKYNCSDCYNRDNDSVKAEYLILNHPLYPRDVHLCRHHLATMFDWFTHTCIPMEITIIKLEK